jgi:4-diphosphocytidyl-2-C-methyl-D-erythritol kinase
MKNQMEHAVLSPAKVNLLLKVVSKRPDGYHNLVSLVDLISLFDVLHIRTIKENRVVVNDIKGLVPGGPENTIYRAAMLMKETFGIRTGVEIAVEKNIPLGAGLGGGSSNAAATIKELARLWELDAGKEELSGLGRKIGADVPLFLYGKPCVMRGIGERITGIDLPRLQYLLVYPNIVLSTGDVYNGLRIVLTKDENEVKFSGKIATVHDIAGILENDLEAVAFLKCPEIKTIKERLLESGAVGALMSGSGSAVFGIFLDKNEAERASKNIGGLGRIFIAESI